MSEFNWRKIFVYLVKTWPSTCPLGLGDTTNPPTWSGTGGHGLGKPHSCIVLSTTESSEDESRFELELLVLRSFGAGGRAKVEKSLHNHLLLPLPFTETPPSTPVGFGAPLVSPRFQPLKETWLVARVVRIEVLSQSKLRKYVPRAMFPKTEIARIKSYMQRLGISPNSSLMLIPTTGSSLNPAPAISPGPSSVSQAFPSLPHAVLATGTTARTWSQVVGEAAHKKAADKAATEKAAAETQGGSYEEEFPSLSKTYGLPPAMVRRIQVAAVQSVALYGAEIWWKNQKTHQSEVQKLINRQARSITGMYPSTPIAALMSESGLIPAHIMLDYRQRMYAYRLLSLPDSIPTKDILPITFRIGDGNAQPEDQPELDSIWASNQHITTYGQQLARQVSVRFSIDPAQRTEPIWTIPCSVFPGELIIEDKNKAILEAKAGRGNLKLWYDRSKLENGGTGAAIIWGTDGLKTEWQEQKVGLGLNKETFDAEMWGISEALKVAERKTQQIWQPVDY